MMGMIVVRIGISSGMAVTVGGMRSGFVYFSRCSVMRLGSGRFVGWLIVLIRLIRLVVSVVMLVSSDGRNRAGAGGLRVDV